MNISCSDRSEALSLEPGSHATLYNLSNPCVIIPLGRIDISVAMRVEKEVMPYSSLAIISILCLFISMGSLYIYTYTKILERLDSQGTPPGRA